MFQSILPILDVIAWKFFALVMWTSKGAGGLMRSALLIWPLPYHKVLMILEFNMISEKNFFCLQHHFALMKLLQRMTSSFRKLSHFSALAERKTFDAKNNQLKKQQKDFQYILSIRWAQTRSIKNINQLFNISKVVFFSSSSKTVDLSWNEIYGNPNSRLILLRKYE